MKQTISLILVLMTALALSACGRKSSGNSTNTVNRTYKLADASSSGSGSQAVPSESDKDTPTRTAPLLYYPDSTGQYIVNRELPSLSLSDHTLDVKLVSALIEAGVLNQNVSLNSISFDVSEEDKEVILLDFNKNLQKQVSGCNQAKENLLIGSIVNTFLSAYDRELAHITVEGKKLTSKNEFSYADPVPWYDACGLEPFTETAKINGTKLKLSLTRMYSDAGFLINWDTEQFSYRYDAATHTASFHAPDTRHQGEAPASLSISPSTLTEAATLAQVRQSLGSRKVEESSVTVGTNQVSAACLTVSDDKGGTAYYIFSEDGRVWLAELAWNSGEEDTRLARMDYMLSTFQAIS